MNKRNLKKKKRKQNLSKLKRSERLTVIQSAREVTFSPFNPGSGGLSRELICHLYFRNTGNSQESSLAPVSLQSKSA
jgi:hypothetical protein